MLNFTHIAGCLRRPFGGPLEKDNFKQSGQHEVVLDQLIFFAVCGAAVRRYAHSLKYGEIPLARRLYFQDVVGVVAAQIEVVLQGERGGFAAGGNLRADVLPLAFLDCS